MINKLYILLALVTYSTFIQSQNLQCDAGNDTVICFYDTSMVLTLGGNPTVTGGNGNYSYTWEANIIGITTTYTASDVLNDTTISSPEYIRTTDSMFFILTVVDDSGNTCKDSVLIRFSDIISDLSSYTYWFQPGDGLQICGGLFSNIAPVTAIWSPNKHINDTSAVCANVYPEEDICYSYKIIDGGGCEAVQEDRYCFIKGFFDINENIKSDIEVYPNPFSTSLTIKRNQFGNTRIELYDIKGQKIEISQIENENVIILNTNNLVRGQFFIKVIGNEFLEIIKVNKL